VGNLPFSATPVTEEPADGDPWIDVQAQGDVANASPWLTGGVPQVVNEDEGDGEDEAQDQDEEGDRRLGSPFLDLEAQVSEPADTDTANSIPWIDAPVETPQDVDEVEGVDENADSQEEDKDQEN